MITKSPSGSACPYYYKGGELHPLKYGGFGPDREKLLAVMKAEEAFILGSSGQNNCRIWIDLYGTRLDDAAVEALFAHLKAIRHKIFRLCMVGVERRAAARIVARMRREGMDLAGQVRFFSDPEEANTNLQ